MEMLAYVVLMLPVLQVAGKDPGDAYMQCIAGNYVEGETALLTCDFSEDVSKGNFSFFVEQFPYDSDKKVEDILKCNTADDCEVHPDFKFDYNITSKLTLEIPVVKTKHAGIYTCQHVPPGEKPKKACRLEVKEKPLTEKKEEDKNPKTTKAPQTEKNTEAHHTPGNVALGLVILVLIILFIMVVGVRKRNKLHKCFQRSETRSVPGTAIDTAAYNELRQEVSKATMRKLKNQDIDDPTYIFRLDPKDVERLHLSIGDRKRLLAKIDYVQRQKEDNETEDEECKQEEGKKEALKKSDENKDAKKTEDKEMLSPPEYDETRM